jgi:hypothetical protein
VLLIRYILELVVLLHQLILMPFFIPVIRVSVDGDNDNEWLHRGQLTQDNEKTGTSYLEFDITRVYMWTSTPISFV